MKIKALRYYSYAVIVALTGGILFSLGACSKKDVKDDDGKVITPPTSKINYIDTLALSVPLKHVGGLHSTEDFARVKAKIDAKEEPWISGWNKLIANSHAQLSYTPHPTVKLIRGGRSREEPDPDNYSNAMNDVAAAYQLGLRWKISGDNTYAQKAVDILNAWASTCTKLSGDPNVVLAAGFYGYEFAVAAELLRDYPGWKPEEFQAYQAWMLSVFYTVNIEYLKKHMGVCITHCWANWDLADLASVIGIAILTDNRSMYNYAVNYMQYSTGNGSWFNAINYVFGGDDAGLAQLQESGRDQGHSTLVIALLGTICQLTWNQGDDFYGLDDNRFLKACEYTAKYNVAGLNVPFHT